MLLAELLNFEEDKGVLGRLCCRVKMTGERAEPDEPIAKSIPYDKDVLQTATNWLQ